jgi:hypothetical protein
MRRRRVDAVSGDPTSVPAPDSYDGQKAEHGSQRHEMRQKNGDGCTRYREVQPVCSHQQDASAEHAGAGSDMKNEQAMTP